jgi:hypothetical protein
MILCFGLVNDDWVFAVFDFDRGRVVDLEDCDLAVVCRVDAFEVGSGAVGDVLDLLHVDRDDVALLEFDCFHCDDPCLIVISIISKICRFVNGFGRFLAVFLLIFGRIPVILAVLPIKRSTVITKGFFWSRIIMTPLLV